MPRLVCNELTIVNQSQSKDILWDYSQDNFLISGEICCSFIQRVNRVWQNISESTHMLTAYSVHIVALNNQIGVANLVDFTRAQSCSLKQAQEQKQLFSDFQFFY